MPGGAAEPRATLAAMPYPVSCRPAIAPFRRRLMGAPAVAAIAFGADAASFDCKSAANPMEQAICKSPELSALDERLARTYARAIHALSAEGAARASPCSRCRSSRPARDRRPRAPEAPAARSRPQRRGVHCTPERATTPALRRWLSS